ncbi:hypothetical protein B0A48_16577 [Cryoendolithus antarcticus]|uniref:Uncharacterized protein n=1 Tax=Cryoendolithus antarcticus TaxID=1507870 RepID=A0A1V8SE24_9PEZI|nr:hypothetical protein B0A48_16577 [Cryoendolithus antarcticus]
MAHHIPSFATHDTLAFDTSGEDVHCVKRSRLDTSSLGTSDDYTATSSTYITTKQRNYLMGILPAELRNRIVDDVISSQPLLLQINNDKGFLREGLNNLAVTQACRLAREHRHQARTSTRLRIVTCKSSLIHETRRAGDSVLLLDQVKDNLKPEGLLILVGQKITDVEISIGSLAVEPVEGTHNDGSPELCFYLRGLRTARQVLILMRQTIKKLIPGVECSVSLCPIDLEQQKDLEAYRVMAGLEPFGTLIFRGCYHGSAAARSDLEAYFLALRRGFADARTNRRIDNVTWAKASGELRHVERRTKSILAELFKTP